MWPLGTVKEHICVWCAKNHLQTQPLYYRLCEVTYPSYRGTCCREFDNSVPLGCPVQRNTQQVSPLCCLSRELAQGTSRALHREQRRPQAECLPGPRVWLQPSVCTSQAAQCLDLRGQILLADIPSLKRQVTIPQAWEVSITWKEDAFEILFAFSKCPCLKYCFIAFKLGVF